MTTTRQLGDDMRVEDDFGAPIVDGGGAAPSPIQVAWRPIGADALIEKPPARRWLLEHPDGAGLLPLGIAATLASAGGVGKTYLLLQLAVAVITGRPWLGAFRISDHVPRRAALLLGEEDADEVRRRLYQVAEALELTAEERELVGRRLVALPLAGQACPLLMETQGAPASSVHLGTLRDLLARHAGDDGWGLVAIDPQARFAGLDVEGNNRDATVFVQHVEQLAAVPGQPTVLVSAHSSKWARREKKTDVRGVTGLFDGFRWAATLTSQNRESVQLDVVKNNYARPTEPVILNRSATHGGILLAESEAERQERQRISEARDLEEEHRRTACQEARLTERIASVVESARNRPGLGKSQLAGTVTGKRSGVFAAIDAAVGRGLIENRGTGTRHAYHPTASS